MKVLRRSRQFQQRDRKVFFFLYIVRSTYVKIEKSSKERPLGVIGSTEGEDYIQSILLLLFRFLFMREFRKYIYLYIQIT